jgi:hypothetical protein
VLSAPNGTMTGGEKRRLLAAVALVGVLAAGAFVVAAFVTGDPETVRSGGPLRPPAVYPGQGVSASMRLGQPLSVGLLTIENRGDATAEIQRVALVGRGPHLRLVGAVVVPDGDSSIGSQRGFPPPVAPLTLRSEPEEAVGAHVAPGRAVEMIIGVAATRRGDHRFSAVAIEYRVGGDRYRTVYPVSTKLCVPYSRNCPAD